MIEVTFKTKTNETLTLAAVFFSYQLFTEDGENGPRWNFSGSIQLEKSLPPFLLQQASKMPDAKDTPSGLEVKILLPQIENETLNKDEILLKNVTFSNSWGENFSAYNNSAQANIEKADSEATIYGVDFSAR
ncbi:MAG: hypothetical protein LBQ88_09710 [Treponema sp.]|jgi:hypothetical protein|nr:hypothetical protein [Treponema sp.]